MRRYTLCFILSFLFSFQLISQTCNDFTYDGQSCSTALCFYSECVFASTAGYPPAQGIDWCGRLENSVWFSFLALNDSVKFSFINQQCAQNMGIQAGILTGDCPSPVLVACEANNNANTDDFTLTAAVTPGEFYFLVVDGYMGDQCDFEICAEGIVTSADCSCVVDTYRPGYIAGPDTICIGEQAQYTIVDPICVSNIVCDTTRSANRLSLDECEKHYIWILDFGNTQDTVVSNDTLNYEFDPLNIPVNITVEMGYDDPRCCCFWQNIRGSFFGCCPNEILPKNTVVLGDEIFEPEVVLCTGDCFDFCNETYCETTVAVCRDGCDIIYQPITVLEPIDNDLGDIWLCGGECFELQGQQFCSEGSFEVMAYTFCEIYQFDIHEFPNYVSVSSSEPHIVCGQPVQLFADFPGGPSYVAEWYYNGMPFGQGTDIEVNEPGNYTIEIHMQANGSSCSIRASLHLDELEPIEFDLVVDSLNCYNPSIPIKIDLDNTKIQTVLWTGPSQFSSSEINPLVTAGGEYELVLVDTDGCEHEKSIFIKEDFSVPEVIINDDFELNCLIQSLDLKPQLAQDASLDINWLFNNELLSENLDLENVQVPGEYLLRCTDKENGCSIEKTITISIDTSRYEPAQIEISHTKCAEANGSIIVSDQWSALSQVLLDGDVYQSDFSMQNLPAGTYMMQAIGKNGCETTREFTLNPSETIDSVELETHPAICIDDHGYIQMDKIIGGKAPYQVYMDGELSNSASGKFFAGIGDHDLMVIDSDGCVFNTTARVEYQESTLAFELDYDLTDCEQGAHIRLASIMNAEGDYGIWLDSEQVEQTFSVTEKGDHLVTIQDANGCAAEETNQYR